MGFAYNRKEAKDHGEGGSMVGASLKDKRVLIIDDVITAGTAIREAHALVKAQGGKVCGIVEALDRQECIVGATESAVQSVERELQVRVVSVVRMVDIIAFLEARQGTKDQVAAMEDYRKQYGVA